VFEQQDIIDLGTELTNHLWKEILDVKLPDKFPVYSYYEALDRFG
jgi:aspartyl-tRNA synthetase